MKQLVESILDQDFDIKGVEIYEYDWLNWPCMKDCSIANWITDCNNYKFITSYLSILKETIEKPMNEANDIVAKGYCDLTRRFKFFKDSLYSLYKVLCEYEKEQSRQENVKLFEFCNELFSDKNVAKILSNPKHTSRDTYIGVIRNGSRIVIDTYLDEKEEQEILKGIDKVCKKHKIEYIRHRPEDEVDGEIFIKIDHDFS